jgi:GT2 family glycosyltransferase
MIEHKKKAVSIIVPVYADWASLSDCIDSLLQHVDTSLHRILLVNDSGPDADTIENNIQQKINGQKNIYYFRNESNLGFVRTCNKAVHKLDATTNDILLLNSDTRVTPGFLDGLLAVFDSDKSIAAVSPRSNNATIATIPIKAIRKGGVSERKSFKIFNKMKDKLPFYNISPTAHGFCMLIRREIIKEHGLFDEVFGRGYGEEVDFCMRVQEYGYKCAISNKSFVFHIGARSFDKSKKQDYIAENDKIIRARYPGYHLRVGKYIENIYRAEKFKPLSIKTNWFRR